MICLVVFTDGRWDVLERTIASAEANLIGPITTTILVVDGEHVSHPNPLATAFPRAHTYVMAHGERRGFGGTIRTLWSSLVAAGPKLPERFVFHLEDDFTFERPVDLVAMVDTLDAHPYLVQLALRRQPWNGQERAAGGIVECWPDEYEERSYIWTEGGGLASASWLEHRLFFTTNPSLYRRSLCDVGWPTGDSRTEEAFTQKLLEDPELRFAFWGSRDSGEAVRHIGEQRIGSGY